MGRWGVAILIRVMGEVVFEQKSGGDAGKEPSMCRWIKEWHSYKKMYMLWIKFFQISPPLKDYRVCTWVSILSNWKSGRMCIKPFTQVGKLFLKQPNGKHFQLYGPSGHTQDINRWAGHDPIKLYLWKRICNFNTIFLCHKIFVFRIFFQPLKNVKTILGWWAAYKTSAWGLDSLAPAFESS